MNCNTTHYRANSSSVPGDPTDEDTGGGGAPAGKGKAADADEDDDDDEPDEPDDDDGEDEDDDKGAPKKPDGTPYTQADIDALKKALRKERKAKRGEPADDDDEPDTGADGKPDPKAIERARAAGEEAAVAVWKPLVVNSAATAALSGAGLIGKPNRLLRLIDMDEIDVDPETGEIDGLDEQVADLRKEYPHLFRKKGTRNLDAADKDRGRSRTDKMSATEIQAAQLRGEL